MPVTPPGKPNSLYVLLKYLVDEASERRVKSSVASIMGQKDAIQAQTTAVSNLSKEFETLAKEIAKVEDPVARAAFTDRFEQMRIAMTQGMQNFKGTAAEAAMAYVGASDQIRNMTLEVKNLNAQTREQLMLEKQLEKSGFRQAFRIGITGFALTMSGQMLKRAGELFLSPIQKFAEIGAKGDPLIRRWEMAQRRIEFSTAKIGRTMMREVLPAIEKAAEFALKIAEAFEKHPKLATAAVSLGLLLTLTGQLAIVAGQVLSGAAAIKSLTSLIVAAKFSAATASAATKLLPEAAAGGAGGLLKGFGLASVVGWFKQAGKSLLGLATSLKGLGLSGLLAMIATKLKMLGGVLTALLSKGAALGKGFLTLLATLGKGIVGFLSTLAGSIIGGIFAGFGINELIARTEWGKEKGFQPFGKVATVAAYGVGGVFGEDVGLAWARKMAELFGYIEKESRGAEAALSDFGSVFDLIANDAIELYTNFIEEGKKAEAELSKDILKVEEKSEADRLKLVEEYGEARAEEEKNIAEQIIEITQEYERSRARIIEDFNRDNLRRIEEFERDRQRAIEDYNREASQRYQEFVISQQRLTEDMNRRLAELETDYTKNVERARRDHLRRLRELEEDHNLRVWSLLAERDAIGLADEIRRYNVEKRREEEEFAERMNELQQQLEEQRAAIREDYARRLQEMQEQFAIEEQRRREDFERQQAQKEEDFAIDQQRRAEEHQLELEQLKEQFEERVALAQEQHEKTMKDLEDNYNKELALLRKSKAEQILELRRAFEIEKREREAQLRQSMYDLLMIQQQGYDEMAAAARAYVDQLIAEAERLGLDIGALPEKATGGYVTGVVRTGELGPEFLMSASTTKTAESLLGTRLTQTALLNALASKATVTPKDTRVSVNVSQRIDVHGYLTKLEVESLRKLMRRETQVGILEAIGANTL